MAQQDNSPEKQFDSGSVPNANSNQGGAAQEPHSQDAGQGAPVNSANIPQNGGQQSAAPYSSPNGNGAQQRPQQGVQPSFPNAPQGSPQGYLQRQGMTNQPGQPMYSNGQYNNQYPGNNNPGQPGAPKKPTSKNQKMIYIAIAAVVVVVVIVLIVAGSLASKPKKSADNQTLTGSALYDNASKNMKKLTDAESSINTDYTNLAQDATKSIPVPEENVKTLKADVKKLSKANTAFATSAAYKSDDKLKKSFDIYAKQSKKYVQYMNSFADSAPAFQKANQECAAKPSVDYEQNNYADAYSPYIQTCQNDLKPLLTSKNAPIKKYATDTNQKMTQIATLTQQIQAMGPEMNIFENPTLSDQQDKLTDQLRDTIPDSYSLSFYDAEKPVDIDGSLQDLQRVVSDLIKTD